MLDDVDISQHARVSGYFINTTCSNKIYHSTGSHLSCVLSGCFKRRLNFFQTPPSTVPSRLGLTSLLSLTFGRSGLWSRFRGEFLFPCVILTDSCLALGGLHYGQKFLRSTLGGLTDMLFAAHFTCFLVPSRQHTKQNTVGLSDCHISLRVKLLRPATGHHGFSILETHMTVGSTVSQETSICTSPV